VLFALFSGALAGIIPAWILSSFRAVKMLKNVAVERIMGGLTLRKVLIVFQFSLSLVILIFLSAFYKQFSFMASAETGYRRENIVSIPFSGKKKQIFETELLRVSGVEKTGGLSGNFGRQTSGVMQVSLERDQPQPMKISYYFADDGVLDVMGLKLLSGSNFTEENSIFEREVILNNQAIQVLGYTRPGDAVGEKIWIDDTTQVVITGVIQDFYNRGVGNSIAPLALRNKSTDVRYLNVQINPASAATIIPDIEQVWKKIFPDRAFAYVWLDKQHQEMHDQSATISLLGFLAFMTVAIASLGLLGLVVYTVETKRKEISIRKIIGASIRQLITLLSKGFVRLLLIAGLIALPTGYALSKLFLINFENQVDFGIGPLVYCFVFLLGVGLFMIISQTYKASIQNPVDSLRSE
jgi:putative ABC transport system permease protein